MRKLRYLTRSETELIEQKGHPNEPGNFDQGRQLALAGNLR
jgi:hypothetical protein